MINFTALCGGPTSPPPNPPSNTGCGGPTNPPTNPPTQPGCGGPTNPPTNPPTQPGCGGPTNPPTNPPTQPGCGGPTDPPTCPPTQPPWCCDEPDDPPIYPPPWCGGGPQPPRPQVYISANAGWGGSVSGGGSVSQGTWVTLRAWPQNGMTVVGWYENGQRIGWGLELRIQAQQNRSIEVRFTVGDLYCVGGDTVRINVSATQGGRATGGGLFPYREWVHVSAEANPGWRFTGWFENGEMVCNGNPGYGFSARRDRTLQARFALLQQVTVTVTAGEGGTATGGGRQNQLTQMTLRATPNNGWRFVGWYENGVRRSAQATWTITVTADRNIEARFERRRYTVRVENTIGGTILINDVAENSRIFDYGEMVRLTALPDSGWQFNGLDENNQMNIIETTGNSVTGTQVLSQSATAMVQTQATLSNSWLFAGWLSGGAIANVIPSWNFPAVRDIVIQAQFAQQAEIRIDGNLVEFTDNQQGPLVIDNVVWIPVRRVLEFMGYRFLGYQDGQRTERFTNDTFDVTITAGATDALIRAGNANPVRRPFGGAAWRVNGQMLVPSGMFRSVDCVVNWSVSNRTLRITSPTWRVNTNTLNLRVVPGTDAAIITDMRLDEHVSVVMDASVMYENNLAWFDVHYHYERNGRRHRYRGWAAEQFLVKHHWGGNDPGNGNQGGGVTLEQMKRVRAQGHAWDRIRDVDTWPLTTFWPTLSPERLINQSDVDALNACLQKYEITGFQVAHFIAQCSYECACGFASIERFGAPDPITFFANAGRDTRRDSFDDDDFIATEGMTREQLQEYVRVNSLAVKYRGRGAKFRGAGAIQLTHFRSYRVFSRFMGDEEIMTQGAGYVAKNYFWESAGWWWRVYRPRMVALFQNNNNPTVAQVSEIIYGSLGQDVNLPARQAFYDVCRDIFG